MKEYQPSLRLCGTGASTSIVVLVGASTSLPPKKLGGDFFRSLGGLKKSECIFDCHKE